jgi:phosphatidylglycerophosphate synthase
MGSSWKEIIGSYSEQKRRWDSNYPWVYFVLRPISFLITWLILPLRLNANQVTVIDFLIGLFACIFLALGNPTGFCVGAILFVLFNLGDAVDGNISRVKKTADSKGKFFDIIAGYPFYLVYFSIGIGLYRTLAQEGVLFLIIGAATTIIKLVSMDIDSSFHSIFSNDWQTHKFKTRKEGHTGKWYYKIYINIIDIQGHDFLLVVAAFFHLMGLFLLLSAFISLVNLVFIIGLYINRARKIR